MLAFPLTAKQLYAVKSEATEILYGGAAGGGKLFRIKELLPTPTGWTTMGEVSVGDTLFDEQGQPCKITRVFDVDPEPELYEFEFDDGTTIVSCVDHQWVTFDSAELAALTRRTPEWRAARRERRPSRALGRRSPAFVARNKRLRPPERPPPAGAVRTTREIVETLRTPSGRANPASRLSRPLDLPDAPLPLDPYVLGVWLGDGTTGAGAVTNLDDVIFDEIERAGFRTTPYASGRARGVPGLAAILGQLGVLDAKHVPQAYLRASRTQRLALLQGLMDSDGTVARGSGAAEFCNTNERIVDGVLELIASLGWKARKREGRAKLYGKDCGPKWTLKFVATEPVFRLPRKRALQKLTTRRTTQFRYIVGARPVPSEPGRCISVDSPSRMYLAGRQMVPTHNSHLMRVLLISLCIAIPGLQCYLFRRITEDLHRNHVDGPKGLRALLAPYVNARRCEITEDEVRFRHPGTGRYDTGSRIYLCHCKEEKHVYKYHGAEIHVLAMDELTHFTEFIYRYLRNRVRIVGLEIPDAWRFKLPLILAASNPGNIGHLWVKQAWIDGAEQYAVRKMPDKEGGMLRQYIPATLDDNPYLEQDDPGYEGRLLGLGNDALVRAMRYGDWSVIAGAYFSMFERRRHVIRPFAPPAHWGRFRAMDWGFARPFSVGWYAISDGRGPELQNEDGDPIWLPKQGLVRYREWYGQAPDSPPDTGTKQDIEDVAGGIVDRSKGEAFLYTAADPSMWDQQATHKMIGPSLAERAYKAGVKGMRQADNRRILGWQQVAHRLRGESDGNTGETWPMLLFAANNTHLIRTLPAMQHDDTDLEDINSDLEDHAVDELRYACMSRPRAIAPVEKRVYDSRSARALFPDMFEERQRRSTYRF